MRLIYSVLVGVVTGGFAGRVLRGNGDGLLATVLDFVHFFTGRRAGHRTWS
jgi:uncharacterized membrane protein YeaQ/YmgE (transglycosylase-associated protein family)